MLACGDSERFLLLPAMVGGGCVGRGRRRGRGKNIVDDCTVLLEWPLDVAGGFWLASPGSGKRGRGRKGERRVRTAVRCWSTVDRLTGESSTLSSFLKRYVLFGSSRGLPSRSFASLGLLLFLQSLAAGLCSSEDKFNDHAPSKDGEILTIFNSSITYLVEICFQEALEFRNFGDFGACGEGRFRARFFFLLNSPYSILGSELRSVRDDSSHVLFVA